MQKIPDKVWRFLWHFIKKQPIGFFCLTVASLAKTISNTVWPVIMGDIIDQLNAHVGQHIDKAALLSNITTLLLMICGFWLIIEGLTRARGFIMSYVFPRMEANMRTEIFGKVSSHSYTYFVHSFMGSIGRRIEEIPRSASFIVDIQLSSIQPLIISMLISAYICLSMHPLISSIFLTWMGLHALLCWFFCKRAAYYSSMQSDATNALQGKITDSLSNTLNVKLFNSRRHELAYIAAAQEEERLKNIKSYLYIENIKIALSALSTIAMFSIFYLILQLWYADKVTLGEVVLVFNLTANLMIQLWTTADDITYLFQELGICQQSLTVMHDRIDTPVKTELRELHVTQGKIEFKNVTFKYRNNNNLFEEQSVTIHGGQKVGLVGFSGSGKTTFANLILRLYEINGGEILIDGQNIADSTEESLRSAIAMIPQEPALFHRTLLENIRYGKFDASIDEVIDASKHAHCHEFITRMEHGYNTTVGERGTLMSGGQRQRIGIARAILKQAKIIILDEATSALDSVIEQKIRQSLDYLLKGRTALIIAHRLSTLLNVDRILVFDNGCIIEDGSHKELIARDGLYSKLWKMQSDGILPDKHLLAGELGDDEEEDEGEEEDNN